MSTSAKFWDKIANKYAKQPVADENAYQKKLENTRGYLNPDSEVLEFGCGTGSTALLHAPLVKHIRAIDISSNMIEIAQAKADVGNIKNITFEVAAIDDLIIENQSLDVVLGMSILHLVEDRAQIIAQVYNMLKPGGVFISSTTCLGDSSLRFIKYLKPIGKLFGFLPDELQVFTTKELEKSFIDVGFEIDCLWSPAKGKAVYIVAVKS